MVKLKKFIESGETHDTTRQSKSRSQENENFKFRTFLKCHVDGVIDLSCPQPVYRWYKGRILPSVEHLCALSKLLNVHMEDLLVMQGQSAEDDMIQWINDARAVRLLSYRKLCLLGQSMKV